MLRTLRPAIFVCAALIFFGVVCIDATVPAVPQEAAAVTIKMTAEHKFIPENAKIKVGQSVEWSNDEPNGIHQVTDDPDIAADPGDVSMPEGAKPFDSKLIKSGKTYRQTFTVPGVYKYACPPHEQSGMIGQVTVTK